MIRILLLAGFLAGVWSSMGCELPEPENAVPLAGGQVAADVLWDCWGEARRPVEVLGVPAIECPDGGWGFVDPSSGRCAGAMHDIGSHRVWLSLIPGQELFSWSLPHELVHMVHGDAGHTRADLWDSLNPSGMEGEGTACLRARPEVDAINL